MVLTGRFAIGKFDTIKEFDLGPGSTPEQVLKTTESIG